MYHFLNLLLRPPIPTLSCCDLPINLQTTSAFPHFLSRYPVFGHGAFAEQTCEIPYPHAKLNLKLKYSRLIITSLP